MNKAEYLSALRKELASLSKEDTEDIIRDYSEHFEEGILKGRTEEEIAEELGDYRSIAKQYGASPNFYEKTRVVSDEIDPESYYGERPYYDKKEDKRISIPILIMWLIFIVILGAPLLITAYSLVFSILVTSIALIVSGLGVILVIFSKFTSIGLGQFLYFTGSALIIAGFGGALFNFSIWLTKKLSSFTKTLFIGIKRSVEVQV